MPSEEKVAPQGTTPGGTDNTSYHQAADTGQCNGDGGQDASLDFRRRLLKLPGVVVWVADPTGQKSEFRRPLGWPDLTPDGNDERIRGFSRGKALCLNTGGLIAVVDVDPRNRGDIEKVRALLAKLGVRVFVEVKTPSGGWHFYIAGHEELPSVHSTTGNNRLPGYPGVDVQSFGCNVYLPGTRRPKWNGLGYEIVFDDLDTLADGDPQGGEAIAGWVAGQLGEQARRNPRNADDRQYFEFPNATPWTGGKPDARQQAYLNAVVGNAAKDVASSQPGGRNQALFIAATKCASFVEGAGLDGQVVVDALLKAAEDCELITDDGLKSVQATMMSGFKIGCANPRAVPAPETDFDKAVEDGLFRARVHEEVRRRLRPPIVAPPVCSLTELLAQPDTEATYRIQDVHPANGRTILSGPYKAGKTILLENLIRSLTDRIPFLGRFPVNMPAEHLVLIDNELSEHTLRRWLRNCGIYNAHAVADVVSLRGRVGAFDLLDDRCRASWARRLCDVGCDFLILDCLRPVLDALGLDENHDAGKFSVAFDALLAEAGIADAVMAHHMGHAGERSRGDSRLQDWPDAMWRMVRENAEQPDSPRYFSAYGRDVDVAEGRLDFDPQTRRMTYSAVSRQAARQRADDREVLDEVIEILATHHADGKVPMTHNQIVEEASSNTSAAKSWSSRHWRKGSRRRC
jgi:hypothetical protein